MGESRLIKRIPGMPLRLESEVIALERALEIVRRTFSLRGYRLIETPLMERAELFLRKSGGAMTHRLYSFDEPGGVAVALRPEMTASVIQHVVETMNAGEREMRFQYAGPVFRYSSPVEEYSELPRQFIHAGAELLGVESPLGDGEIITMANECMNRLGFANSIVSIGHAKPMRELLRQLRLPKRARLFIEDNIELLSRNSSGVSEVMEKAEAYGLLKSFNADENIPQYHETEASSLINSIVAPTDANSGARTRQEIVDRLARKHLDTTTPELFKHALNFVSELAAIKGYPEDALKSARKTALGHGLDPNHFAHIEATLSATREEGVSAGDIRVDFGISRGVSYYTGMLFEVFRDRSETLVVGGGGRYNRLALALGAKKPIPALGFAYHIEALVDLSESRDPVHPTVKPVLLTWDDEQSRTEAKKRAADLRRNGTPAILVFGGVDSATILAKDYPGCRTEKIKRVI